jgi:hypothetical protein
VAADITDFFEMGCSFDDQVELKVKFENSDFVKCCCHKSQDFFISCDKNNLNFVKGFIVKVHDVRSQFLFKLTYCRYHEATSLKGLLVR